jgi:hypothetical protein
MARKPNNAAPRWRHPEVTDKKFVHIPELSFKTPDHFQEHDWKQHGQEIICEGVNCTIGHRHGHRMPGLMLVGDKGNWGLVAEGGTLRLRP